MAILELTRLDSSTVCVDNYTEALINGMYPHANAAISGNTGRFVFAGLQKVPENFYTTRVDYKLGNNDTLFGTYLFDDTDYTEPDKDNDVIDDSHTTRTTVALEETHTFSSGFLNVARIGYNRDHVLNDIPLSAVSAGGADMSLGSTLGETAPRVTVSGLADIFGRRRAASNYKFSWNSYQAYDDAFWTHGKHTIKFGGGPEWMPFGFRCLAGAGRAVEICRLGKLPGRHTHILGSRPPQHIQTTPVPANSVWSVYPG